MVFLHSINFCTFPAITTNNFSSYIGTLSYIDIVISCSVIFTLCVIILFSLPPFFGSISSMQNTFRQGDPFVRRQPPYIKLTTYKLRNDVELPYLVNVPDAGDRIFYFVSDSYDSSFRNASRAGIKHAGVVIYYGMHGIVTEGAKLDSNTGESLVNFDFHANLLANYGVNLIFINNSSANFTLDFHRTNMRALYEVPRAT